MSRQIATQPVKRNCFRPSVYHLLMIKLDTSESLVTLEAPDGMALEASYIHARTGAITRNVTLNLQGPIALHLQPSDIFPGWYYIQEWSEYFHRFGCSCLENKQYSCCNHVATLVPPIYTGMEVVNA